MTLTFNYPEAADTDCKKYCFCYRVQVKLQDIHNNWGQKFRDGVITEEQWKQFLTEWFNPRSELLTSEILRLRNIAKNQDWNIDLNDVFIEE